MIFLDSSALLKRYVAEPESGLVDELLSDDHQWGASALARTETAIALCRRMSGRDRETQMERLREDWRFVLAVPIDAQCLGSAQQLGCRLAVRTGDAIHLAAASRIPGDVRFLSFDQRQVEAAFDLGLSVIVPTGDAG